MAVDKLVYRIEHSLTLPDGRILSAEVLKCVTPGRYHGPMEYCYPDETEYGEYFYKIDGVEIDELDFENTVNEMFDGDPSGIDWEAYSETLVEPE